MSFSKVIITNVLPLYSQCIIIHHVHSYTHTVLVSIFQFKRG